MRHQFAQCECGFCWKDENDNAMKKKASAERRKDLFFSIFQSIKKTTKKARELQLRLEHVFEDDVHLMVQLFH